MPMIDDAATLMIAVAAISCRHFRYYAIIARLLLPLSLILIDDAAMPLLMLPPFSLIDIFTLRYAADVTLFADAAYYTG